LSSVPRIVIAKILRIKAINKQEEKTMITQKTKLTKTLPDCPRCKSELAEEEAQVGQEEVGMYYCDLCHIFYDPIDFADFDDQDGE
jgi:transposase-like protein